MAPVISASSPEDTFTTAARLIGVANIAISLSLAGLLALSLTDLAHYSISVGVALLLVVLTGRWLLSLALFEWNSFSAQEIRRRWRSRTVEHLRIPRLEGERSRGELLLAIDHAAEGPSLEVLATSARLSVLGLAVVFWSVGWLSTLITVVLMALAVPLYQRAGKRSETLASEYQQRRATLESRQLEMLSHAPELRSLGATTYGANEIAAISDSENTIALRAIRVALESSLITEFLSGVSIGLVAMVVGFSLLGGRVSLVRALIAVLITGDIFTNIRRFGTEFHRRENAQKSATVLRSLEPTITRSATGPLVSLVQVVTHVDNSSHTLQLNRGDRLLVTGASGSGKTTLLHTIVGWRTPRRGSVRLSENSIGYVSVESRLVTGSLWTNVTLDEDIARERVVSLLNQLGLNGPRFDDLDTLLLADGRGLSPGETVRIVLARSLIRSPDLLILDDIAGVLDESTRQQVRDRLGLEHTLAIIEATVDTPLLAASTQKIELHRAQ